MGRFESKGFDRFCSLRGAKKMVKGNCRGEKELKCMTEKGLERVKHNLRMNAGDERALLIRQWEVMSGEKNCSTVKE